MARQSTYGLDDDINENDLLAGSDYLGTKNNLPGGTPRYATKNFRIRDLSKYFANGGFQDGDFYNLAQITTNVAGNTTSIASINQTLTTHANDISSGAQYSLNLASSFGVADANGNITSLSQAFANLVLNVATSEDYATASQLTSLTATVNNQGASITANANNITSVTASTTTNTNNISTANSNITSVTSTANSNASDISTLTSSLATTNANVTQSATDITNLTATVSTNTTNITNNDADITSVTNTAATNASNITTLTNNLATTNANVTQNATNHTSLSATVTTNTTNITSNDADITTANTNIASNASDITTLTNNLATANTSITQNASNVTSLTSTVNTNTTTIAGKPETFRQTSAPAVSEPVGSLWFDTDDGNKAYILVSGSPNVWTAIPDTRIAANATSITTNSNNITANASDITTLTNSIATTNANVTQNATNVTNLTSTVTSNTAAITSNDGDITTANTNIASNASDITTLTNNLATANTAISQNASNHTSLTSTVSTNTTNITLKPEVFRQNNAPAVTGATGSLWYDTNDSNKLYVLVAGNPKVWTVTDDSRIAANATSISTNTSNISTNASNITTLTNDLNTAEADITQNATNTTNLTSTVSTNTTNISNKPNVYRQDAAPAVTVPVGSLWYDTDDNNKIYILVSGSPNVWTETRDTGIATNATNITNNTTNITSNASDITTLTNNLATTNGNVTQNATNTTNLTATVNTNTTNIASNDSDITTANTNIATNASNITTLTNDLNTAEADIVNNASNVTSLTTTVNTNTTNISGKPNVYRQNSAPAVTVPVGSLWFDTANDNKAYVLVAGSPNTWEATQDTRIATNATNISTLNTGITTTNNNVSANSTNITTLTTDLNTAEGNITSNASSITSLTSTVNGNTTSITTNASSINGLNGKYGVTINANGALTGFELNGGGGTSSFIINANDFKIFNSSGNLNPFSVSGNKVQINGDLNVTSAAVIGGTATGNDLNGRPTALFLKNLGTVSGDDASVCLEMQSAARWHHVIRMFGGTDQDGNFDLSAQYRLGKSLVAGNEGDNYSQVRMMLNGGGLIIPDVGENAPSNYDPVTSGADFQYGSNIFFNSNNASINKYDYARMHVNEYFKTFFLNVPGGASHSSGSTTYDNRHFSMRVSKNSAGAGQTSGTWYSSEVMYLDTNEHLHVAEVYDIDNSNLYLDFGNTGDSLKVAGDVVAFVSSDKRYKDNIVNISSPLDKLSKINGVSFNWNEISHKETGKKDIGVIAQEIEQVLPEIVETRDNGYKAVDYPKLTALLIEAVKELSDKVKKLEDGITG